MLPLARALAAAGHDVTVACRPSMTALVASAGIVSVPVFADEDFPVSAEGLARTAAVELDRLMKHAGARRPDVVVREWAETAGLVVALEHEVPCVVAGLKIRPGPPEDGAHPCVSLMEEGIGGLLGAAPAPGGFSFDLAKVAARHARIARRADGAVTATVEISSLLGDLWLSFYPPVLAIPGTPPLAAEHHFQPPVFDHLPDERLPSWFAALADRPIVLATLGTTVNHADGLLEGIVEAAGPLEVHLVVATGPGREAATLGDLPDNVHVTSYLPLSLASRYCAAIVMHGGFGTTMTALRSGVPVLCVPVNGDQPVNARRCAEIGAGLSYGDGASGPLGMDAPEVEPDRLRAMLQRILDEPSFASNARRVADDIAALPPIDRAVPLIEDLVGQP
jgi:MGT family glycosyltransferase